MAKDSRGSGRRSVPVSSRKAAAAGTKKPARPKVRLGAVEIGVLVVVAILILATIAVPLRNYFQQRTEIARLTESISAKETEKQRLQSELEKYDSDEYVAEQARQRLGVIGEGETAYRIIDPRMDADSSVTSDDQEIQEERAWYELLWTSVSDPESLTTEESETGDIDTRMPLEPGPGDNQEQPAEQAPAPAQ